MTLTAWFTVLSSHNKWNEGEKEEGTVLLIKEKRKNLSVLGTPFYQEYLTCVFSNVNNGLFLLKRCMPVSESPTSMTRTFQANSALHMAPNLGE